MLRVLSYLWALPTSLPGLLAAALTLATGGRGRRRHGVLEIWGGFAMASRAHAVASLNGDDSRD